MKKPIRFGKYLLLERVNVGGMAEVFKAKAFGVEGFERLVAVKRILPSIAEDTEFITMFIDEAKIAVQLTHANIAQVFDLGKVIDSYFIAMEYVQGKDLRALFDRARKRSDPLPLPMTCYVIMKVCEGLDYAHNKKDSTGRELNLVHRDVSPQNILISYDGDVKIVDFGVAKAAGKAGKTQAGILKGKFGYMSPEQVRGLPLDRRSDIFALGIILYELLTGERLFVGESDFSTLEKVRNVEIMPPSTYNRQIPEELEQIVLKALAKDVDERYQSAMDLHDDLQSFMYTSGNFFARKDLVSYMQKSYADEISKESAREEEYRSIEIPKADDEKTDTSAEVTVMNHESDGSYPSITTAPEIAASPRFASGPVAKPIKPTLLGMPASRGGLDEPPMISGAAARTRSSGSRAPHPSPMPFLPSPSVPLPRNGAGPALDVEWDDENLSTQIYDKPENSGYTPPGATPPPDLLAAPVYPPIAAPPPAGDRYTPSHHVTNGFAAPPAVHPSELPLPGAPSPFADAPQGRRDSTAVTNRPNLPKLSKTTTLVAAAAMLVLIVGTSIGAYFAFSSKQGTIELTTDPVDPVVLFDREPVPTTSSPFLIADVEPNRGHLLEVSKAGYKTWSTLVRIRPGETRSLMPVRLSPLDGSGAAPSVSGAARNSGFALESDPAGARVWVDGRELSQRTPVRIADLPPGQHSIRVEHGSRFETWETQIRTTANRVITLPRVALAPKMVRVRFQSEPSGAQIELVRGSERRTVGSTPTSSEVDVTGGTWTVEATKTGYKTASQALSIQGGQDEFTVTVVLESKPVAVARATKVRRTSAPSEPKERETETSTDTGSDKGSDKESESASGGTGTLRINSRPWSQVFVDGRLIGNTPQMSVPLRAGKHKVTLVNSEFNIRHALTIAITAGETVTKILDLEKPE